MPTESTGTPRVRPMTAAERLAVLETWRNDHEDQCRERYEGIQREVAGLKAANERHADKLDEIGGAVASLLKAFDVREVPRPDGSTQVKTRALKLDWKLAWGAVGAAGGLVVIYQVFAPTLAAMALAFHHAVMRGTGG